MADVAELPRVEWVPGQQPLPGLAVDDVPAGPADDSVASGSWVVTLRPLARYL